MIITAPGPCASSLDIEAYVAATAGHYKKPGERKAAVEAHVRSYAETRLRDILIDRRDPTVTRIEEGDNSSDQ